MWGKISILPVKAYLGFKGYVQDFKEDEQGLSGVVVAVLLSLVAILAVVALWGLLDGWLVKLWGKITEDSMNIS